MGSYNMNAGVGLISPSQVRSKLRSLFDPSAPASLRCFAVLDGNMSGQILTDDPTNPTWGVVREAAFGSIYLGGWLDAQLLSQIVAGLRKAGDVLVGLWVDDERLDLLPPNPDYVGSTLEFTDRPVGEGLDVFLGQVPAGCDVRRMDRALFERSLWRDDHIRMFGSAERFLEKVMSFCLMRGDEILSEGYAGPLTPDTFEMGVITPEPHRRRGYATIICAHVIQACEALGYQTYWNCAKQNVASAGVARKLGYRVEKEYRLLAWFKSTCSTP